jgi:hypothetical protein
MVAGEQLQFSGAVAGNYLGAGKNQVISGRIHGALRAVGGELRVTAAVDRNATLVGGGLRLERAAVIGHNAYLVGGTVRVDGTVHETLIVSGGTVILNGTTVRDVEVVAGELRVGPLARIDGNLRYRVSSGKVQIDPSARIGGRVVALPVPQGDGRWALLGLLGLVWMIGLLLVGIVVVLLLPRLLTDASALLHIYKGRSALMGLGWVILVPLATIAVAATLIGLPLAFFAVVIYIALLYLGRIAIALRLGHAILGHRSPRGQRGITANYVVGELSLLLIGLIPFIGMFVVAMGTVLGIGAIVLRLHALRETQRITPA